MALKEFRRGLPEFIRLYAATCLGLSAFLVLGAQPPDVDGVAGIVVTIAFCIATGGALLLLISLALRFNRFAWLWLIVGLVGLILPFAPGIPLGTRPAMGPPPPGLWPALYIVCSALILLNLWQAGICILRLIRLGQAEEAEENAAWLRHLHGVPDTPKP